MNPDKPEQQEWEDLIARIREAVDYAGGPSKAAAKSGLSRRTITGYRVGETTPSSERLLALALGVGINPGWLLTGKGPKRIEDVPTIEGWGTRAAENVVPYQAPPTHLDQALMESAMLAVLRLLEARNLKLSPERTVAGVMAVYEAARAQGKGSVTDADVTPLVRLLMA